MAKASSHKSAEEVKDPSWIFAVFVIITILLAIVLLAYVDWGVTEHSERIEWWKIVISAASLAISLFLGSIVAIQAYQYVNRLSHDWKIRHDYAIERLDRIYGPLWDEAKCIVSALEMYYRSEYFILTGGYSPGVSYDQKTASHIQRYKELTNSHLQLFLTKPVMEELQAFHKSVLEYDALRTEIQMNIGAKFSESITKHGLLAQHNAKTVEGVKNNTWSEISQDYNLGNILNPKPDANLERQMKERFVSNLTSNVPVSENIATGIIDGTLKLIREEPGIAKLHTIQEDCTRKSKTLLLTLEQIIRNPESALE